MELRKLEKAEIQKCLHPREKSRFWLGVAIVTPITLLYLMATRGFGVLILPIIFLFAWVAVRLFRAYLLGSCAEVSPDNFPEVYQMLQGICLRLDYPKKVELYIFQEGEVNAFLIKRFRTRIILLPHELLVGMLQESKHNELIWILSRAVGHLKSKHLRLWWLNILIESFEKLVVLNIFLYPWERATQYSGDRIGLAVCRDLNAAVQAMNKLMLGNELAQKTTLVGALKQRLRLAGSFFGWLAESLSTHPHLTNRVASLISWARTYDATLYEGFIERQPDRKAIEWSLEPTDLGVVPARRELPANRG